MNTKHTAQALVCELKALWKESFGDTDETINAFFDTAYSPEKCRVVIDGGELCSALYILDCTLQGEKVAYIYAVSTAKAHRNRGCFTSLLNDVHIFLESAGYAGALLVPASKELFPFYERFGYEVCSHAYELHVSAASDVCDVREVTPAEYARIRTHFASKNHVTLSPSVVNYLGRIERFYAGDGFLFSARTEDGLLRVSEFFGDKSKAGAIVKSLGYEGGVFRLDGGTRPFAMYRSFRGDLEPPPVLFTAALD